MDVYVWEVLRRDQGLSRIETQDAIQETVSTLLERGQ